ncbi:MAG: hypothetical protein HY332_03915 [Chloroflexi bacterium]|nr:hypothetical protein [Chloroflexota bacterium]
MSGERLIQEVRPPRTIEVHRRRDGVVTLGDRVTLEDSPQLLRLLMQRNAGAPAPLGRAIHPMTTVPLGLAIDAAIEAAGGYDVGITTLRYCQFSMEASTTNRRALRSTAQIVQLGRRHVEAAVEVWEEDRLILQGRVGLVRVHGGRASPLTDRIAVK